MPLSYFIFFYSFKPILLIVVKGNTHDFKIIIFFVIFIERLHVDVRFTTRITPTGPQI